MNASLTSIRVVIPDETGLAIIKAMNPLEAYRAYLVQTLNLDPKSITNYDVDNLRRACVVALGERELAKLGVPVPVTKED